MITILRPWRMTFTKLTGPDRNSKLTRGEYRVSRTWEIYPCSCMHSERSTIVLHPTTARSATKWDVRK